VSAGYKCGDSSMPLSFEETDMTREEVVTKLWMYMCRTPTEEEQRRLTKEMFLEWAELADTVAAEHIANSEFGMTGASRRVPYKLYENPDALILALATCIPGGEWGADSRGGIQRVWIDTPMVSLPVDPPVPGYVGDDPVRLGQFRVMIPFWLWRLNQNAQPLFRVFGDRSPHRYADLQQQISPHILHPHEAAPQWQEQWTIMEGWFKPCLGGAEMPYERALRHQDVPEAFSVLWDYLHQHDMTGRHIKSMAFWDEKGEVCNVCFKPYHRDMNTPKCAGCRSDCLHCRAAVPLSPVSANPYVCPVCVVEARGPEAGFCRVCVARTISTYHKASCAVGTPTGRYCGKTVCPKHNLGGVCKKCRLSFCPTHMGSEGCCVKCNPKTKRRKHDGDKTPETANTGGAETPGVVEVTVVDEERAD